MASRESLIESHAEECESDDTILMSQVMKHKLFAHICIQITYRYYFKTCMTKKS